MAKPTTIDELITEALGIEQAGESSTLIIADDDRGDAIAMKRMSELGYMLRGVNLCMTQQNDAMRFDPSGKRHASTKEWHISIVIRPA